MLRLLSAGLTLLALIAVAAMVPVGHSTGELAAPRSAAPVAKRPAWPAWAHSAAAAAAAPVSPKPAEHALNAVPGNEHQPGAEHAGLSRASAQAGLPERREQSLRLALPPLHGVSSQVATPPPRFT